MLRLILPLIFPLFISCSVSYEKEVKKDYRIYVDTSDRDLLSSIQMLADKFNDDIGLDALTIVTDKKDANSKISFIKGLRSSRQKLGLGQWVLTTVSEGRELFPSSRPLKRTLIYSMELEFDYENFKAKSFDILNQNDESDNFQHLYHLFCHEVGHGLQMEHDDEKYSIMYKSIPDSYAFQPEYEYFFGKARLFFEI